MEPMQPMKPMQPMAPMKPMEPMQGEEPWWPKALGTPDSSGSQDGSRYAYFASARRLVVDSGGTMQTYDTGRHRIHGVGQQNGESAMRFQSDEGDVALESLSKVD